MRGTSAEMGTFDFRFRNQRWPGSGTFLPGDLGISVAFPMSLLLLNLGGNYFPRLAVLCALGADNG